MYWKLMLLDTGCSTFEALATEAQEKEKDDDITKEKEWNTPLISCTDQV
jgi:hypothetical protein